MSHWSLELHEQVAYAQREDMRRDAAQWRLLQQAGRRPWLPERCSWFLCQLGRWMVSMGRQLQRRYGRYEHSLLRP